MLCRGTGHARRLTHDLKMIQNDPLPDLTPSVILPRQSWASSLKVLVGRAHSSTKYRDSGDPWTAGDLSRWAIWDIVMMSACMTPYTAATCDLQKEVCTLTTDSVQNSAGTASGAKLPVLAACIGAGLKAYHYVLISAAVLG